MSPNLRAVWRTLQSIVTRGVTGSRASDGSYQVGHSGDQVSVGVEHLEPQGVHFVVPSDASAIMLSPGAARSASVMISAQAAFPTDPADNGEGGLHYLGAWKVFLASDGTVHLSGRLPGDFVALASKVDSELSKIKADFVLLNSALQVAFSAVGAGLAANGALGAASIASYTPHSPAPVGSEKVRAG